MFSFLLEGFRSLGRFDRWALILVLISLIFRVGAALILPVVVTDWDDLNWLAIGLIWSYSGEMGTFRPPAFGWMIGIIGLLTDYRIRVIVLVQAVLMSVWMPLIFLIGRRLMPPKWAFFAMAFCCLWPGFFPYGYLLLSEALAGCCLLLGTLLAMTVLKMSAQKNPWVDGVMICTGFVWGVASLVRDANLYIGLLLAFVFVLILQEPIKKRLLLIVLFLCAMFAPILPHTYHHYRAYNAFILISNNGPYNMMLGWSGQSQHATGELFFNTPEAEQKAKCMQAAITGLKENPFGVLTKIASNFANLTMPDDTLMMLLQWKIFPINPPKGILIALWISMAAMMCAIYCFAALGLLQMLKTFRAKPETIIPVLVAVSLLLIYTLVIAMARHQATFFPLFILLAFYGAFHLAEQKYGWSKSKSCIVGIVLLAFAYNHYLSYEIFLKPLLEEGKIIYRHEEKNQLFDYMKKHYGYLSDHANRKRSSL